MAIFKTEEGVKYDQLIGGGAVSTFTVNGTIAAGQDLKRGTLLALADGKYTKAAKGTEASAVLVEDVKAEADTVTPVYTRGLFNREALIVDEGDTVEAHEEALRKVGIYVTGMQ